jgi:hypothetical protein
MRKNRRPKLRLERESLLNLETAALEGARGALPTARCPTRPVTCMTCITCTC